MKHILFIFLLLGASQSGAFSFETTKETTVRFTQGNSIVFPTGSILHVDDQTGWVTDAEVFTSMDPVVWTLSNGEQIQLDCSSIKASHAAPWGRFRMVKFHSNREYSRGCSMLAPHSFDRGQDRIEVAVGSILDLSPDGEFETATKIEGGSIWIQDQKISLAAGTDINYFENGQIDYFTPDVLQSFDYTNPVGVQRWTQFEKVEQRAAFRFFEDGAIRNAVTHEAVNIFGIQTQGATQLLFEKSPEGLQVFLMRSTTPFPVEFTGPNDTKYNILSSAAQFDEEGRIRLLEPSDAFEFVGEYAHQKIQVTVGSRVFLNEEGKVTKIDSRMPQEIIDQLNKLRESLR